MENSTESTRTLPEGWCLGRLEEICYKVQSGSTPKEKPFTDKGDVPFLKVYNIVKQEIAFDYRPQFIPREVQESQLSRSIVLPDDILMNIVGPPLGKVAVVTNQFPEWNLNQALVLLRPRTILENQYLYYFLLGGDFVRDIMSETKGSVGQVNISLTQCRNCEIPLPPLNEQHRIVNKIEALTARSRKAREALDAIPALLDQFRQSVLAAAFRGDLTADWREQNPDVEPAEKWLRKFSQEREYSYESQQNELKSNGTRIPKLPSIEIFQLNDQLPDSWLRISVESACVFIIDCLHSTPKFVKEGEYCIDTTCISPFHIRWESARQVSTEDFIKRTSRLLPKPGDIFFSREGTIGTAVQVPEEKLVCLGQRMMMFRFGASILPEYAAIYLQSPHFKAQYKPLITGTTSPHVNIGELRKLIFLVPSIAEQSEIVKRSMKYLNNCEQILGLSKDNETSLSQLDQSILAKAFRGELVPQDPTDEPATLLLQRIQAEREKLNAKSKSKAKAGTKRKKQKP